MIKNSLAVKCRVCGKNIKNRKQNKSEVCSDCQNHRDKEYYRLRKNSFWNKFFIFLTLFFILLPLITPLSAELKNPKAVFRINQSEVVNFYIDVKNPNNMSVDIEITPPNNKDVSVEIVDRKFTLKPMEEKRVYYNLTTDKSGQYNLNVVFKFSERSIGLQQTIQIIVFKDYRIFYYVIVGVASGLIMIVFFSLVHLLISERGYKENDQSEHNVYNESNVDSSGN